MVFKIVGDKKVIISPVQALTDLAWLRMKHANNDGVIQALALLEQAVRKSEETKNPIDLNKVDLRSLFVHLEGNNKGRASLEKLILMLSGQITSHYSLYKANLDGAMLDLANLEDADLEKATLKRAKLFGVFLNKANLKGANLTEASLVEADLIGTNLRKAKLYKTNLAWANLTKANLNRASLVGARLEQANFYKANLKRADLTDANLTRVNLNGANLKGAYVYRHGKQITGKELKLFLIEEFNVQVDKDTKF